MTSPPDSTAALVDVSAVARAFGDVEAVRGVSFRVRAGEVFGLLGPNGAGKSTTIGMICGLLRPDRGRVRIGGFDVVEAPESAKRLLGVVPQETVVIEELSALENCLFYGSLYGVDRRRLRERAARLLEWIGLADKGRARAGTFSGGQLRRLALVLGIVHEPRVLVLDEPTVGLDPQTRLLLLERIREIADGGTAVLLSTHYLDEAERLCDRIAIVDHGEIRREGTLADLRAEAGNETLLTLRGAFDARAARDHAAALGGALLHADDGELTVSLEAGGGAATAALERAAGIEGVTEVSVRPPSLENLFIRITGRQLRD